MAGNGSWMALMTTKIRAQIMAPPTQLSLGWLKVTSKFRHYCFNKNISILGPGICGLEFLWILSNFPITRETETNVYSSILQKFNFWMIKLTKTPNLPNFQVPNCTSINFITQKLKSKHLVCLSFLWWQVFLREWGKTSYTYFAGPKRG